MASRGHFRSFLFLFFLIGRPGSGLLSSLSIRRLVKGRCYRVLGLKVVEAS